MESVRRKRIGHDNSGDPILCEKPDKKNEEDDDFFFATASTNVTTSTISHI